MASIYSMVGNHFVELNILYDNIQNLADGIDGLLNESEGEITAEISALQDSLESLKKELAEKEEQARKEVKDKIDDYCKWLKNVQSDIDPLKKEEARIAGVRRRLEKKVEWIKGNILCGLNTTEDGKANGLLFSASIRKSSSTEVDEEVALAPFKEKIDSFISNLPIWLSMSFKFNKTLAKKEEVLPEGFTIVNNQSLIVK